MSLPSDDEPRSADRDQPSDPRRDVPVGGALMLLCSSFALIGFPLDDVWHRLFGQDVTLWGPTHIMMIAGAVPDDRRRSQVLETEGQRAAGAATRRVGGRAHGSCGMSPILACGGLLIGLSVFQGEFDWGVPQFRQVWHPLLLAGSSSVCFVAARLRGGRGGAIGALIFYLVMASIVNALVGDVIGRSKPAMPLYIVEALCVEAVGWPRGSGSRPIRLGVISGLLIGTVGFAAEYAWTNIAMPVPWHTALLAEGLPTAIVAGVAGGIIGALFAGGLRGELPAPRTARILAIGAGLAFVIAGANALIHSEPSNVRATIGLQQTDPGHAYVTAKFDPPSAAQNAEWVDGLAWQGDGLVINHMKHVGAGTWRTTKALPISGHWKTMRAHPQGPLAAVGRRVPARGPGDPVQGLPGGERLDADDGLRPALPAARAQAGHPDVPVDAGGRDRAADARRLHRAAGAGRRAPRPPPRPGETAEPPRFTRTGKLVPAGAR